MKIETPILKRLGPVPFWRGERKCLDSLEVMYRKAIERANRAFSGEIKAKTETGPFADL